MTAQEYIAQRRVSLRAYQQSATSDLLPSSPPPTAQQFVFSPAAFSAYPAPGAAAVVVLQFVVPLGRIGLVTQMAINHFGGGIVDGSGNVIWRVLVNGGALEGMEQMISQLGSWAQPNAVFIPLHENDVFQVTVEVPAGSAAQVGQTAARAHGYTVPMNA